MKNNLMTGAVVLLLMAGCAPDQEAPTGSQPTGSELRGQERTGIIDEGPEHHLLYTPGAIEWQDAPASLEPGAQVAVLEGNPGEAGVFTMRIRMPDGFHISPHWHPNVERVTVVSGTFLLGSGDELDRDDVEPLEAGSYTSMPPEMTHYAIAEGETIIQLTSVGPWVINYVNPEDDPRQRN